MTKSRSYTSPVRDRHAEDTRQTIIAAARDLFAENGYPRTSIAAIAKAAGVAVNTVYTSVGGKPALILAVTEMGAADDAAAQTLAAIGATQDAREILRITAQGTGKVRRRQGKTLTLLLDNRTADPNVAAAADMARDLVRKRLGVVADHLVATGQLRSELTSSRVDQILWFYFGFEAWRTARSLGWTWIEATDWLATQAETALIAPPADRLTRR